MPTINNETVIGSGYYTYTNARPQLLSNGWIVASFYNFPSGRLQFRVKKSPTGVWEDLAFLTSSNILSWSLAVKGTRVFTTLHTSLSNATSFLNFDATTVSSTVSQSAVSIDNTSTSGAFNGEDLAINDAGTELHHAFSAKTPTYPNSFNIRYIKGTIAADGSVTWGAVIQATVENTADRQYANPTIRTMGNVPILFYEYTFGTQSFIVSLRGNGSNAFETRVFIFQDATYKQSSASAVFIPQSINGLANGRLWVAWQGKDATDSAKFNIRTSYSDDSGVTWTTPTKQTTGNTYDQVKPSLTADKNGKVLLYWNGDEDASGNTVTVTKEKIYNGTWGATTSISGDNHYIVTTLFDCTFSIGMTRAPFIRYYASGGRFTGNYTTGATVSPLSSALGNKETSSVLSYTVTPESGSTITSIVEKVNGTTVNTYSNPASLSRTFTIPLMNWDALKYYNTHTISVTVTDSNGMANTQTYTFNKALANDASLLEGAKAAKDGKDRISTKRDVLAGQVGLAAGSTFDAISAQLASGNVFKKFATGTVTATTSPVTVNSLNFKPSIVILKRATSTNENIEFVVYAKYETNMVLNIRHSYGTSGTFVSGDLVTTDSGFTASVPIAGASSVYSYIAFG